jgi:ribosomal protein L22
MAAVETERQTVRAQAKWVRSSARKARLVTDLIRGRTVPEARTILAFSQRAVARDVEKVLRSAVANAESRPDLRWNGDDLVVARAHADEGRTLKRARARARGRVASIKKRTCHITIELAQVVAADTVGRQAPRIAETAAPVVADTSTEEPAAEAGATAEEGAPVAEAAGESMPAADRTEASTEADADPGQEPAPEPDEGEEEH